MNNKIAPIIIKIKIEASWGDILKLIFLRIIPNYDKVTIQDLIEKERGNNE